MPIELGDGVEIRVAPPELPTVVLAPPLSTEITVLPVAGSAGPPGPAGPPGGSYYAHIQTVPAATWIIDHDLGKKVHVTIFDLVDRVIYADVDHGSLNQTTITFPSPVTGSVVIS